MNTNIFVQKLCNYCNVLRIGGISDGNSVERLTFIVIAGGLGTDLETET
jgi:hypothetical protein